MRSSARITYSQRHDAKTVKESNVLAAVYKLCLARSRARKEAAPESRPDDARKDRDAGTYSHCT
jgi:hypothetical protein